MSPREAMAPNAAAQTPLRRFAAIGVGVTVVDVGLLLAGARLIDRPVLVADAAAISVAAVVSWVANRSITFADDPAVRWVKSPGSFVATVAVGGAVDIAVLALASKVLDLDSTGSLLGAKVAAVGVAALFRAFVYRSVLFNEVRAELTTRIDRPPAPGTVRLSVVVPAYYEEERITATIARLRSDLAAIAGDGGLEIVVVDDGSTDGTAAAARSGGADQVVVQPQNRGKGAAVRAGMMAARGRTIAFTDADLAYAPEQLERLLAEVEDGWDVVVGNRHHQDTTTVVKAPWIREVGGRIINRFTYAVLLGHHRDTQCGIKAFRSDVARLLFSKARIDGFAFDVEIFHLVERYHLSLTEVPVSVENSDQSTVHVARDASRLLRDLLRVLRGGRKGWYDLDPAEALLSGDPLSGPVRRRLAGVRGGTDADDVRRPLAGEPS